MGIERMEKFKKGRKGMGNTKGMKCMVKRKRYPMDWEGQRESN